RSTAAIAAAGRGRVEESDGEHVDRPDHPRLHGGRGSEVLAVPEEAEHERLADVSAVEGEDGLVPALGDEPGAVVGPGEGARNRRPLADRVAVEPGLLDPDAAPALGVVGVVDRSQPETRRRRRRAAVHAVAADPPTPLLSP